VDKDFFSERCAGALLGLAVGDALGRPAEGLSPYGVFRRFQTLDAFYPAKGSKPGEYGFKAQLALVTAKAIQAAKGVDPLGIKELALRIHAPKPRDEETRLALERLASMEPALSGSPDSASPSFLPRMVPVGLWGAAARPPDGGLLRACAEAARMTHSHRPSVLAGFVVARIVKEAVAEPKGVEDSYGMYGSDKSLLAGVIETCRRAEAGFVGKESTEDKLWMRLDLVSRRLQSRAHVEDVVCLFGGARPPTAAQVACLAAFCFMRCPDSFSSVVKAASMGGPADSVASLVGAMCGAFSGPGFMPEDMRTQVEGAAKIEALAKAMAESLLPREAP